MLVLDAALEYAGYGWSVIPVRPDKKPVIAWKEFAQRRASPEQIRAWFLDRPALCVGVICGSVSNLIVVDIEREGLPLFRDLPITRMSMSQSGGVHWYYRWRPEEVVRVLSAGKHVGDVRSDGQYVLAPPSVGLNGPYEWMNRSDIIDLPDRFLKPAEPEHDTLPMYTRSISLELPPGDDYPSRSERIMAVARHVKRRGGNVEEFKRLAYLDWSSSKLVEKGKYADTYLEDIFDKTRLITTGNTSKVWATLRSVSTKWTTKGKRFDLFFDTDCGKIVRQGVTDIESERLAALHACLPVLKSGQRCQLEIIQANWRGKTVWRVKAFVPRKEPR